MNYIKCRSMLLWGYECPFEDINQLAADHCFPYSLGGPTLATNKIYLCKWHNQIKAGDIHIFPWELGEPQWLLPMIDRIKRLLSHD